MENLESIFTIFFSFLKILIYMKIYKNCGYEKLNLKIPIRERVKKENIR